MNQHLVTVIGSSGQLARCLRDEAARYPELKVACLSRADFDVTDQASATPEALATAATVVYTAALHDLAACEAQPEKAILVNAEGVRNVLARMRPDATLVYVSTDYVFGADHREEHPEPKPYVESDPVSPVGAYGRSKAQGEAIALDDPRGRVVRTASLFSRYGSTGKKNLNFGLLVTRTLRHGGSLKVDDFTRMTPGYGPWVAAAIFDIAISGDPSLPILHAVCCSPALTWLEFARVIAKYTAPEATDRLTPRPPDRSVPRPAYSALRPTRALRWMRTVDQAASEFAASLSALTEGDHDAHSRDNP